MNVYSSTDYNPGRFRNLIQSTVIPKASKAQGTGFGLGQAPTHEHKHQRVVSGKEQEPRGLYDEEEEEAAPFSTTLSSSLGLSLPNPAPEIDMNTSGELRHMCACEWPLSSETPPVSTGGSTSEGHGTKRRMDEIVDTDEPSVPKKKKYAKEAWPGRKPGPSQGLF